MDYGLALSGGGTRGAAHVGILKALEEENLLPSSIAGASAGSIAAGFYAAGISIDDMSEIVVYLSRHGTSYLDPDIAGMLKFIPQLLLGRPVSLSGFLKGNKLLQFLCTMVGDIFLSDVSTKTVIPAVDINTGNTIAFTNSIISSNMEHIVWERNARLCEVMMASSSVPTVFCPREIGSYTLVDGGVTNNLPVDILIGTGVRRVIAVDIGSGYEPPYDDSIIEIASHSFSIMSRSLKECMSSGETLLLKPKLKKGASLLTFDCMIDCMEEGYVYAKKMMPIIRKSLS